MSPTILHVVQRLGPGGIERLAVDLARRDPAIGIVSLEGSRSELARAWPALASLTPRLFAFGKSPGVRLGLAERLARLLRVLRPRAVVTHHEGPLLYGGLAARRAGVAVLAHVEHDDWHLAHPRRRLVTAAALRLLRPRLAAVSGEVARAVAPLAGGRLPIVIPPGVDPGQWGARDREEARRRLGLSPRCVAIGCVGRLEPVKGQDVLIDALALLARPEAVVLLAGDGSCRGALAAQAARRGVAGQVRFLGEIEDVPGLHAALDVLALPSRAEGLPRALIEARASGLPVVASDVGACAELVDPACGRLTPPDDPAALAAALAALIDQPPARPAGFDPAYSLARVAAAFARLTEGDAA